MFFNAHSQIFINEVLMPYFSEVDCKNDCKQTGASCDINIPLTARYARTAKPSDQEYMIAINRQSFDFKKGQSVKVTAWYDELKDNSKGGILTEFEGFIYDFVAGNPLKIRCLDYFFFFQQGTINLSTSAKKFNGQFKDVLQFIIDGANKNLQSYIDDQTVKSDLPKIVISKYYMDFQVADLVMNNLSPAACLEWLKKELSAVCTMIGNELYFSFSSNTIASVNLHTKFNVIGKPKMQLPEAAFQKFKMQAYYMKEDGTKRVYATGDDYGQDGTDSEGNPTTSVPGDVNGELHELNMHFVKNKTDHIKLIDNAWREKRFGHYTGTLETLLYPKLDLFYKVVYTDFRFPERSGNYVVREHNFKISEQGYHRSIKLAYLDN
jgi:hypothetical protein